MSTRVNRPPCPPFRSKEFDKLVATAADGVVSDDIKRFSRAQRGVVAGALTIHSMVSQSQASEMFGVNRTTVQDGKLVFAEATDDELEQVRLVKCGLRPLVNAIRSRTNGKHRPKGHRGGQKGRNQDRIQNQKMRAVIWGSLRDSLVGLTSLPLPSDVAAIARCSDRTGLVDSRILKALKWLEEFADVWTTGTQAEDRANEAAVVGNGSAEIHAGEGYGGQEPA